MKAEEDNLILVSMRGDGLTMNAEDKEHLNHMLCNGTKEALSLLNLQDDFRIQCFYTQYYKRFS